ncbi:MAG: DNA adenine methylase [Chloroflexi bacterium]|nr:DNA adenine methylase [Chloroflexota bacterium]
MSRQQGTAFVPETQMPLWDYGVEAEDPAFLTKQLLTYIGNKRTLLGHIGRAVDKVKERLGKKHLRILDAFAGSGIVSRYLKSQASFIISNDIEDYAAVVGRCYLRNSSSVNWPLLLSEINDLNDRVDRHCFGRGFIEELYAPRDEDHITKEDRVFYTKENAKRLDNYRRLMEEVTPEHKDLLLAPLLSEASIHANTAGVFKGFYKNSVTKVGQFGGTKGDALSRIRATIKLVPPILSRYECDVQVLRQDANETVRSCRNLDLVYIDPPYNQHPYGANYFMLNLLVHYERPEHISKVSGIPINWRRSDYNVRTRSLVRFRQLVQTVDTSFLLISFNNEGFISPQEMISILQEVGTVDVLELPYNTFRGSRNLRDRDIHVTEQLFLVERR